MYLRSVTIENIRSIRRLEWRLTGEGDALAGWHVLIGENGAGKSTFLRAVALALVGTKEAYSLRQDWAEWLPRGADPSRVSLWLAGTAAPAARRDADVVLEILGGGSGLLAQGRAEEFSASYGPFRRFTGGDAEQQKLFQSHPRLARHLSVFGEAIALTEALEWLKTLKFKALEKDPEGALLAPVMAFVNQPDFLPHDARLEDVTSKGVHFVDGNGCKVPVESLSDGYRSILSMTFELIRQLAATYGPGRIFSADGTQVVVPGVVLVDEIDAHLHPTWQRRIGLWYRRHFPRLQFIVTTHSPLVCQAAEHGTVFRLPRPGSDDQGGMVTGLARDRLLYGDLVDAFGTGAFGEVSTRSEAALGKLQRLADLNLQAQVGPLSEAERHEQQALRAILPTAAASTRAVATQTIASPTPATPSASPQGLAP